MYVVIWSGHTAMMNYKIMTLWVPLAVELRSRYFSTSSPTCTCYKCTTVTRIPLSVALRVLRPAWWFSRNLRLQAWAVTWLMNVNWKWLGRKPSCPKWGPLLAFERNGSRKQRKTVWPTTRLRIDPDTSRIHVHNAGVTSCAVFPSSGWTTQMKRGGELNKTGNVRITSRWGAFVQPLLQLKSNKYYIFWVCICNLQYPAYNAHAQYCHLWPGPL